MHQMAPVTLTEPGFVGQSLRNVTVPEGRDVVLSCTVKHLDGHKVRIHPILWPSLKTRRPFLSPAAVEEQHNHDDAVETNKGHKVFQYLSSATQNSCVHAININFKMGVSHCVLATTSFWPSTLVCGMS